MKLVSTLLHNSQVGRGLQFRDLWWMQNNLRSCVLCPYFLLACWQQVTSTCAISGNVCRKCENIMLRFYETYYMWFESSHFKRWQSRPIHKKEWEKKEESWLSGIPQNSLWGLLTLWLKIIWRQKKPLNFFRRSINETNEPTFDMISESNRCENLPGEIYIVSMYLAVKA